MNINKIYLISKKFYKLAAFEFGEEEKWIPEEFKQLPAFKTFPYAKAEKIFSSFGIDDFSIPIEMSEKQESYKKEFFENILSNFEFLTSIVAEFGNHVPSNIRFNLYKITKTIVKILRAKTAEDLKLGTEINESGFYFPANENIINIYQILVKEISKYKEDHVYIPTIKFDDIKPFTSGKQLYLVFSTKPSDLAGIASRGIESCQSLFKGEKTQLNEYNNRLAGTILSKYVGVCFITTGKDYKGRGAKMLARSLVRQVYDIKTHNPAIVIDKLYPFESKEIKNIMKEELQKRSNVEIITDFFGFDYYSPEFEEETIESKYRSYHDRGYRNYNEILEAAKGGFLNGRLMAAENLKIHDLHLLMDDENPHVRLAVIKRLPKEKLNEMVEIEKKHINYDNDPVIERHLSNKENLLELAKRLPENEFLAEFVTEKKRKQESNRFSPPRQTIETKQTTPEEELEELSKLELENI